MQERQLTGRLPADRIRQLSVPRLPAGVVEALSAIEGVTNLVSDIMDEMFLSGVIAATELRPTIAGRRIVGPALTVRNVRLRAEPFEVIRARHVNRQADIEAHNLATPGDVLVIQGHRDVSNIGGMSSMLGKRQGTLGAIVWGGTRDVAHSRGIGFPIWSTGVTPVTGKWRMETAEINGEIQLGTVMVACGDLIVADESGVCFVPRDKAAELTERVLAREKIERRRMKLIEDGVPVADLPRPNIEIGEE